MTSDLAPSIAADIKLSETLDLAAAPDLAKSFLSLRGRNVVVDASHVLHLAAPCVQVLLSALAAWRTDCRSLTFRAPSFAFLEGSRLLGVSGPLGGEG